MPPASNFTFLRAQDAQLAQLGTLAERYFRDDPGTAVFKLRQFGELLSKTIAARHALYVGERETFEDTLRRLAFERIIPKEAADIFHALRKAGNRAAHEATGNHSDALSALKFARQLGIWFHRTYGKHADFKPGPFVPPPEPVDATAPLREEIDGLRRRVAESEDAASRARREAEEHARALESVEQRLAREAEERAIWEKLAAETESKMAEIATRLAAVQAAAEQAPKAESLELIQRGEEASTKIDLDEAATRALIDQQLIDSGWEADTKTLRYANGTRPVKGHNLAIAEWPTASGPADYALFVGPMLVGVVEAKRRRKNVSAAIDQAERYSSGMAASDDFSFAAGAPRGKHKVPFVFADRLQAFRNDIAPTFLGRKPDTLFITSTGKVRGQAAVAIAIQKTILRFVGVKMTPHQFRHLCAKIILDQNPGAYELVRQLLGHTSQKTTTSFYAGVDTLRAGRAHADLINEIRESHRGRGRRRPTRGPKK